MTSLVGLSHVKHRAGVCGVLAEIALLRGSELVWFRVRRIEDIGVEIRRRLDSDIRQTLGALGKDGRN